MRATRPIILLTTVLLAAGLAGCGGENDGQALPAVQRPAAATARAATPVADAGVADDGSTVATSAPAPRAPAEPVPVATEPVPVTTAPAPVATEPATPDAPGPADPCTLAGRDEIAAMLGGPLGEPVPSSGSGGRYHDCTWALASDELTEVRISVNADPASYDPSGWTRGEVVAVEGVGEQSFISTDFGVRIGFVRDGVAVSVVAPIDPATAPTWIELARLVDGRLQGLVPMP